MRERRFLALLLVLVATAPCPTLAAGDLGARLYGERCTACHGVEGRGDGPVAAALDPPPRDFHDPTFWETHTIDDLRKVVRDGRPGTLMQAFGGVLSDAEISAVVDHLGTFRPSGASDDAAGGDGKASGAGSREDAAGGPDRH